jgi:hypothetical protein
MRRQHVKPVRAARPTRRAASRQTSQKRHLGQCPVSGKVRFRDKREALDALHHAVAVRRVLEAEGQDTRRKECRVYPCPSCNGWHLTSQPADYRMKSYMPSDDGFRFESQFGPIEGESAK